MLEDLASDGLVRGEATMAESSPPSVRAVFSGCVYYFFDQGASKDPITEGLSVWALGERPELPNPNDFGMRVEIGFRPDNETLGDNFDAVVCSPNWLARQLSDGNWTNPGYWAPWPHVSPTLLNLGSVWLMERWSQDDFEATLKTTGEYYSPAPDWETLCSRLTRHFHWEFEYRFDDETNERNHLPPITKWISSGTTTDE